ncbi:endolytic transglycosylase MltG [Marinobacter salexigens]|uniref:Endolytic murein transglycosylase n=1 Tax=Marinobacter salexigens TaxID=1925763 RepID=A0ABS6ABC8_9GAMM|nr:endolytic transglycosylase MltG [Marinobacter salexigens]MBU2875490.1 endolytic transglycosylase MltG [Marinobacter salexigens]
MFKKLLIAVICAAVLIGAGSGLWVWQGLGSLSKPVTLTEPVLFDVPNGTTFNDVARQLRSRKLVEDSLWVRIYGRLFPDQARIKAGEYEFTDGMSAEAMLSKMVAGDTKHWSVQFIEGWTFRDMRSALAVTERLEKLTSEWSDAQIMEAVGAEGEHPEGRFFPDTYLFTSSESDLDLLRRSFRRMESVLAEEWESRAKSLPYDNAYEALIMASIVERETGAPHERDQVAGVFVRRLQKGMRLQTDPTVIYGMGDKYKGRIGSKDLRIHTPYNTYRISGLPPTPIALPGREAIHASLHPGSGKALYFVARGDGTHKFSNTLAEHQKAVRAFQLNRRSDYRSSPAPDKDENK